MGVRGEIFSNKVILPNRTYFFNVKENRMGDLYLNIVESKNRENGGFDRQSVILFADDLQEFLKGFDESLKVMEKASRNKRQSGDGTKREFKSSRENKDDRRDDRERNRRDDRGDNRRTDRGDSRRNDRGDSRRNDRGDNRRNDRRDRNGTNDYSKRKDGKKNEHMSNKSRKIIVKRTD